VSRATLLPTPGDPLLLGHWLRNFDTYAQHAGKLYVGISWPEASEGPGDAAVAWVRDQVEARGGALMLADRHRDHGQNLQRLIKHATEDVVLLTEDDLYVRTPSEVDKLFTDVEQGTVDFVGVPRGSMSMEMIRRSIDLGFGPVPSFWPHLFFVHRDYVRSLECTLGARSWAPGEWVPSLGLFDVEVNADTFGEASLTLRTRKPRWAETFSYHSAHSHREISADWFHVGSLSTGPFRNIEDCHNNPIAWASRIAWYRRLLRTWPGGLDDYVVRYAAAVDAMCTPEVTAAAATVEAFMEAQVNWVE
jgi:hypothetical protein